jgi:spore coat protein CotH
LCLDTVVSTSLCAADKDAQLSEELLFSSDRLVRIEITIAEADWDALRSQSRSLAAALSKGELSETPYTYFRGDVSIDGVNISSVGIRKKGFLGSQDEVRPSLKVKFSEFKKNGRIGGLDRLTLNNNKQDSTQTYQFLGYRLYREAGLPAPRCGLAEVLVNGRSLGVYSNVESVKKPFLKNEFGDDSGNLYEGTYPADFYPDRVHRFEAKTNKKKNDRTKLRDIARLLEKPGEDLAEQLAAHIEMEQFHKFWALESLIGFWDGYCANQNNYFVYVNPADSRICFIPWGLDSAFSESIITPFNPGPASVKARGLLAFRLYQNPKVRTRHVETVRSLLDTVWKEQELIAGIDRVTEMTKGHRHEAQGDAKKSTDKMKAFISARRRQILNEIKDGPVDYKTPPPPPMYSRNVGEVAGTFSTVWADKPGEDRLENGSAELTLKVDGKDITFSQIGVIAEPRPPSPLNPPRPGPPPPTLTFTGKRESNGKTISLWIGLAEPQFQSSDGDAIAVQGLLMEAQNFFTMRFFAGTVILKEATRKEGASVSGSLKGSLFHLKTSR